jgi:hypothetical protein
MQQSPTARRPRGNTSLLGDGVFTFVLAWQLAVDWHQPALLGLLLGARVLAEIIFSQAQWQLSDQQRCVMHDVQDVAPNRFLK